LANTGFLTYTIQAIKSVIILHVILHKFPNSLKSRFFLRAVLAILQSPRGQKLSFFSDSPWNSVWKYAMTYNFWTTYQGFRRGQRRKSEDFDQNTKSGLKSTVWGFINRETAQNDHNKILYMIMG
jgi:hypothetical protein